MSGKGRNPMGRGIRSDLLGMIMVVVLVVIAWSAYVKNPRNQAKETPYGQFLVMVKDQKVKDLVIYQKEMQVVREVRGHLKEANKEFLVSAPDDPAIYRMLSEAGVDFSVKQVEPPWWVTLLGLLGNILIPLVIFLWLMGMMRQMQGGSSGAMSFGKSRAKLFGGNQTKVTFADVAGVDEAKEELKEVIDFLKDPQKFQRLGGKIPKGVLLLGPPGSGKTLLARAVAGEAGTAFFTISGSDFVEMFVGVGAARVRDLFEQGKKNAPCIIFVDEIDAVGRHRGAGLGGGHDEREQTLNALLVEMDGFETNRGVIIMAATNRPDVLDPALLRPGRFDRTIVVDNPDIKGREGILKVHTRQIPMAAEVDLQKIARGTPGFSGADLANLVNEGALLAARRNKKFIEMNDLEEAKDRVLMGPARKSRIISDKEKRITAWHESGHTLVNWLTPGADPLHKVTIIPRGRALGVTASLPTEDRYNRSRSEFMNDITMLLGGRAAEMLEYKDATTGAANDLERATTLATRMVCEFGMNEELGPRTLGHKDREIFLGRDFMREKNYSEETARIIDHEIEKIIEVCYARAESLLKKNKSKLEKLAEALLEREVLDGEEVDALFKGVGAPRPKAKINNQK